MNEQDAASGSVTGNKNTFTPYRWQEECLRNWTEAGYRGIADVVTGAGKTGLAIMAVRALKDTLPMPLHVFVIVPTCALQDQWVRELRKFFPLQDKIGRIGGGAICGASVPFQVCVVNSARILLPARRNRILENGGAVLLIADECHHYGAEENRKIFSGIPQWAERYYTLGLSATPKSNHFEDILIPCLGPVIYRYAHTEALTDAIVSPFCIQQIAVSFTADELGQYVDLSDRIIPLSKRLFKEHPELRGLDAGAFFRQLNELEAEEDPVATAYNSLLRKRREVVSLAESRMQCVADLIAQLARTSRIIIFCERISQADLLFLQISEKYPHQISKYHSAQDPGKNRDEIRNFRDGYTRILVTCKALDEGVDVPSADVAVIMSCTTIRRQRIQRLGRILRTGDPVKHAVLYYLYIRESSEESAYLSFGDSRIPDVYYRYLPCDRTFFCPAFDRLLETVLERAEKKGATEAQITELIRQADLGMIRADWQRTPDSCGLMQKTEPRNRNYWTVMKWMAAAYQDERMNKKQDEILSEDRM